MVCLEDEEVLGRQTTGERRQFIVEDGLLALALFKYLVEKKNVTGFLGED